MFWLGLILVLVGWFAGRTRLGTAARTTTRSGLESVGGSLGDTPVAGAGRWTLANALWLRIVVGVLGVVVLLWGADLSVSRLFWSFVLVGVLLAVIQVLVGTGRAADARSDDRGHAAERSGHRPDADRRTGLDLRPPGRPTKRTRARPGVVLREPGRAPATVGRPRQREVTSS